MRTLWPCVYHIPDAYVSRHYFVKSTVSDFVLSLVPRSERTQSLHSTISLAQNPAGVFAVGSVHDLDLQFLLEAASGDVQMAPE